MKNKKMPAALIAVLVLGVGNSEASSSFNSQATLGFTIDSIRNINNLVDLSGLAILGSFEQAGSPTSYVSATGNGSVAANNPGLGPVSVTVGNPLIHTFAVNGNVSNGTVDSGNVGWYALTLNNSSAIDDYSVKLTLAYNLLANASGEFANSDVILDTYTNNNPLLGNVFVNANSLSSQNAGASGSFPQYTFDIAHGSSLVFYADVTINGSLQASPVPLPAVVWSFLAGLLGILGLNKRKSCFGKSV